MPNLSSLSTSPSVHALQRSALDLGKVVRRIDMESVRNRTIPTYACRLANASGHHYRNAAGAAISFAFDLIERDAKSANANDAKALTKTLEWLKPGGESVGQIVLDRLTVLGAMHAGVVTMLEGNPGDAALLDCKGQLEKSIHAIALSAGNCQKAPDGCHHGGETKAVNKAVMNALVCLETCAGKLDRQALFEAVALKILPGPMMQSIQERLPQIAARYAESGVAPSEDLMNLLQKEMAYATQVAIDNRLDVGHGEDVQNALMNLLKLPEYVIEAEPGKPEEASPPAAKRDDAAPRDIIKEVMRSGGNVNYAPVTVKTNQDADQKGVTQTDFVKAFMEAMKTGYEMGMKVGELNTQLQYVKNDNERLQKQNDELVRKLEAKDQWITDQQIEIEALRARPDASSNGDSDVRNPADRLLDDQGGALLDRRSRIDQPSGDVKIVVTEYDSGLDMSDVDEGVVRLRADPDSARVVYPQARDSMIPRGRGEESHRVELDLNAQSQRIQGKGRDALQKSCDLVGGFGARLQIPRPKLLNPLEHRQVNGDGLQQSGSGSVADLIKQFEAKTSNGPSTERVAAHRSFDQTSVSGRSETSSAFRRNVAGIGQHNAIADEFTRYLDRLKTNPAERRVLNGVLAEKAGARVEMNTRGHSLTASMRTLSAEDVRKFVDDEKAAAQAKVGALVVSPVPAQIALGEDVMLGGRREGDFISVLGQDSDPKISAGSLFQAAEQVANELMVLNGAILNAHEQGHTGRQTLNRDPSVSSPHSSRPGEDVALSAMASRLFASIPRADIDLGYGSIDDIDEIDDAEYPDSPVDLEGNEQFAGDDENLVSDQVIEKPWVQNVEDDMIVFRSPFLRPNGNVGKKDDPGADRNTAATW